MRRTHRPVALVLAVLALAAANANADGWDGEVGVLGGSHDNFFYRGEGSPAPESDLLSSYLQLERAWKRAGGEFQIELTGSAVDVRDIDEADYQTIGVEGTYKRGRHRWSLEHSRLLNRLFAESGDAVFFDERANDLQWRVNVGSRWWVRLRWERAEWDFDAAEDERDADIDKHSLTGRFQAMPTLGIRLAWLAEEREARSAEHNRTGDGLELAFEGAPNESVTWFLRFRSRDRDYTDAPSEARNFGRADRVNDLNFNLRWRFGRHLGLYLRDMYRDGDSTRADRNYDGNVVEAGLFYSF